MKYIKTAMVLCAIFFFLPVTAEAQNTIKIHVDAIVRNTEGQPIAGAIVSGDEGEIRGVTDETGAISLQVSPNSMLFVKAVGYKSRVLPASQELEEIILEVAGDDSELVQVAFRGVEKKNLLGGVSVINTSEIMEKNYMTYSLENLGAYAGGFVDGLWGMGDYLMLVDGVPRTDVVPTEIEQITLLKGASAVALYGSRAAKGVILITTKRGEAHNRKMQVRANTGFYVPKSYPEYLGSAEYMTYYNEARRNDGLSDLYTPEDIWNHASGTNPYRYPDVDYYSSDYLKKAYNRSDVTAEISGGNDRARFYTNIGFWYANSLLDVGEAKNNNTNRFNIRGNVDLKLNDYITGQVDATAIFYNDRSAFGDYFNRASSLRPNRFAPLIPISMVEENDEYSQLLIANSKNLVDGKYMLGGTQQDMSNPFADMYAGGYSKWTSRQFQFTTALNIDMERLLKGLSFRTQFSVDYSTNYTQSYNNDYAVYEPIWNNYSGQDLISSFNKYNEDSSTGIQNLSGSNQKQTIAFSAQFNYVTKINDNHNISAMLIGSGYQQSESTIYHAISNVNLGLQAGYNYQHKYYADFSGAVVHSAKLPSSNRTAFSPTLSLGWRLSKEEFLQDSPVVDHLKLTASAGILQTDLDISDYYLYQGVFSQTSGNWQGWRDGESSTQATDSQRGENLDLSFPKRKEVTVGVEASLFKRLITVDANFFVNRMTGLVIEATTLYPLYFKSWGYTESSFYPYVNYNADQRMGVDFNVNLNKRIGQVDWTLGMAGTYYKTKAIKRDELYEDSYQNRTGKPTGSIFGLVSDGFFRDADDIANHASQSFGQVQPGDIKYVDQNNDGIIDSRDEVMIGNWSAPFSFGIHLTAKWKNLTFFALGNGHTGGYGLKNNSYYWIQGDSKYSAVVRDRWTEETHATATYPRLTSQNSDNNFRSSDFWLYKTNRFNLAKVQVTYDLPQNILKGTFISELGIYVSGSDLLTISKERKHLEMNVGGFPQTRFYNLGVKAVF